ncbi:MAG: SurA N-terminal domain-containing protein [Kangiellaceae bacterium]|jgi:peptidyl-prolyl cis-trans isomerase D|nr:SurA N-terminal domain-containing protein [Kangiellaceae bacterium]
MMESIRTGVQKPWVKVMLTVVVISFIFAGYFTSPALSDSPDAVAKVNGDEVKLEQLNNAISRAAARYGEQFDTFFPTEAAKRQFRLDTLKSVIDNELISQLAEDMGLRGSTSQILEQVTTAPIFQANGKFSTVLLDQFLAQQRQSREAFQEGLGRDLSLQQFIQVFTDTELALSYEVDQQLAVERQQRSVDAVTIKAADFIDGIELTDDEINLYYQENISSYEVPEMVSVEYIEIKSDDIMAGIVLSQDEVNQYYNENQDLYRTEEERQVAHILIKTEERSEQEATALILELANKIKNGADFAQVAKKSSEDFSAEDGGDLGYAGRGVMDEAFEEAMFNLTNIGDVSDIVKTEFGLHLIKLLDIKQGEARPLAEVQEQIETRIKSEKAEELFFIKKDKASQAAFDRYDSLSAAAAEAEVDVKVSGQFSRAGATDIFANAEVLAAAFSQEVLTDKRNSSPIEINDSHMIILRNKEYMPSRVKPIEEVKAQVSGALKLKKSRDLAKQTGEELIDKLNQGQSISDDLARLNLVWQSADNLTRRSSDLGFDITRIAFKAPKPSAAATSAYGEATVSGDFALVNIKSVTSGAEQVTGADKEQTRTRVQNSMTDMTYTAVVESLRASASITRYDERIQ